jgi:hypothetical protein
MKSHLLGIVLAGSVFLGTASASIIDSCTLKNLTGCLPSVGVTINGTTFSGIGVITPGTLPGTFMDVFDQVSGAAEVKGTVNTAVDPQVNYSLSFINAGSLPVTFCFIVDTPYLGGPYNFGFSSDSATVTDGGDGAINVTDNVNPSYGLDPTGFGDTVFGALSGGCSGAVAPHSSNACGSANLLSIVVSAGPSGFIVAQISATVSPGDTFALTGTAGLQATTTPEPATYGLTALSLCLAGLVGRRRKNRV